MLTFYLLFLTTLTGSSRLQDRSLGRYRDKMTNQVKLCIAQTQCHTYIVCNVHPMTQRNKNLGDTPLK